MHIKPISEKEFWIFWGVILAAQVHSQYRDLWDSGLTEGQRHKVDYGTFMKQYWFQQIQEVAVHMWASPEKNKVMTGG